MSYLIPSSHARTNDMKQNNSQQRAHDKPDSSEPHVVCIAIDDLYLFDGQNVPDTPPDNLAIETMVERQFRFLRKPLKIEIGTEGVTISFNQEPAIDRAEAARLAERGARRGADGDYRRAISILKRALELQPSLSEARRDLARAYYELGDIETAKNHIIESLRLNPRDALSLIQLGVIYSTSDNSTAERFLRRALEISPADACALTNLAAILWQRGNVADAIPLFHQAIASKPDYPNPHYGLACAYCATGDIVLARRALDGLFINARESDVRSRPVAEAAQALSGENRTTLAERRYPEALAAVETLRVESERASGYPMRTVEGEFEDTPSVTIQMAWNHGHHYHLLKCRNDLPDFVRAYFTAHELVRLQLETAARQVNKNRRFVLVGANTEGAACRIQAELSELHRKGLARDSKLTTAKELVSIHAGLLCQIPIEMVIDAQIRERFPALAEVQFLCMRTSCMGNIQIGREAAVRRGLPRFAMEKKLALEGAYAILLDHLHPGPTSYAGAYQGEESFPVAQRLFRHWQNRYPQLGPGDEYALVDEFGEILDLRGWIEWHAN